ncbi:AfsR/SARP family transcriptional regulator [Streptomyces sp. MST-110588]|uniref:AfsR/SARP family transcriptional regulator n=1 Tax=Streptomyces sp. MST-110588 TaxID=2833628 RepID=UPI001F5C1C95|nr:AfsR/SARP family transcriptional regulator [Streptomyces sp. MST-110588]UNO42964.1 tetratricopeptide repeat protein [Streptomyces sp. MST-110588]
MDFDFRLLGTLEAATAGGAAALGPRLRRLTLGILLLEANRPVTVDRLISLLWDDEPPPTARNSVHGHISRLRRELAVVPDVSLRTRGDAYVLQIAPERIDVHRFQSLLERAEKVPDEQAAALLHQALGLWRGDILADIATDRARRQLCAVWTEARTTAQERRIDAELRLGRHGRLVGELTRLVSDHPTRERFTAQLMIALYRGGRQGEAVEAYRRTRSVLAEEFGLEPSGELQGLAMAVLRADAGLDLPARPAPEPPRPPVVPRQLPAGTVHFTDREEHLRRLDALLEEGGPTVAVVSGTAGVGKTALALHWAHGVTGRFPDGQLFAQLRGWSPLAPLPAAEVLAQFLRALGVPAADVPSDEAELAALYRSLLADRRVLVVLDNAESAEQVRPLLPGGPSCAVVVTSRRSLHDLVAFHDAIPVEVDLLSTRAAVALLARAAGNGRTEAEPVAAGELARLCACLPLALRIAAGRLTAHPARSVAHLVAELDGGAPLSGLSPLGEPAASLRAAFRFSYTDLPAPARAAFRALGLVPVPDLPVPGAAALWGTSLPAAAATMDTLVTAHLVQQPRPGRFALHSLLREYARERVDAEEGRHEREAALGRLHTWYFRHASAAVRTLFPGFLRLPAPQETARTAETGQVPEPLFAGEADARAWLEAEAPSMVAAIQHAGVHGPLAASWQLADALRGFFWLHGRYADWLAAARAGLRAAQRAGDERAEAVMHHGLGHACHQLARCPEAITYLTKALHAHRRLSWREGEAITLGNLGMAYARLGHLDLAVDHHVRAIAIHRETGARASEAIALNNLGDACRARGDLDDALRHHQESLVLSRAALCRQSEVQAAIGLAATHLRQGRLSDAFARVRDAVDAAREAGYVPLEGQALAVLGEAYQARGAREEARLHWQRAHGILSSLNSPEAHELRTRLGLPDPGPGSGPALGPCTGLLPSSDGPCRGLPEA